jgi:two-component system alkaline phosphatase synthesis response regulator PhoP
MKKILCVEDEVEQVELISKRLEKLNYKVIVAQDGQEGLEKAYQEKPDLILLDIYMPKIDGFEVCKTLKNDPKIKHIPIIMVTASGVKYVKEQTQGVQADACILKPYELPDLIAKIKVLLKEIK